MFNTNLGCMYFLYNTEVIDYKIEKSEAQSLTSK